MQTVADSKLLCSPEQTRRTHGARKSCGKTNRPGIQCYRWLLNNNRITNCPCTGKDDEIAEDTHRKDIGTIRGRDLREPQTPVPRLALQDVPAELKRLHKQVRLFVDVLCMNRTPFLHTTSETLGVITSQELPNRFKDSLLEFIKEIMLFYKNNSYEVELIDADLEFKQTKDLINMPMNSIDPNDHVHLAERSILTVKERARCLLHSPPFTCTPKGIVVGDMFEWVINLNRLPRKKSIAEHLSPLAIVSNVLKLDCNRLTLSFGEHVEIYEDNRFQTNSMSTRGKPAIALNNACDSTRSCNFFSLVVGATVERGF